MSHQSPNSRIGVSLVVLAVAAALLLAVGTLVTATAATDMSVNRDGNQLTVKVSGFTELEGVNNETEVSVSVSVAGENIGENTVSGNGSFTATYDIYNNLSLSATENLSSADISVNVTYDGGSERLTQSQNLQGIEFANDVRFDGNRVILGTNAVVGVGAETTADIDGESWTFEVTETGQRTAHALVASFADAPREAVDFLDETTLTFLKGTDGKTTTTIDLPSVVEPSVFATDRTLIYENPLIVEGKLYNVDVDGASDSAVSATADGRLPLNDSTETIIEDGGSTVEISKDGNPLAREPTPVSTMDEDVRSLSWALIEPRVIQDGNTLLIEHPALYGQNYTVGQSDQEYAATNGSLRISEPGTVRLSEFLISPVNGGESKQIPLETEVVNATLERNGWLNVSRSLAGVEELWLNINETTALLGNESIENGRLDLRDLGVDLSVNDTIGVVAFGEESVERFQIAVIELEDGDPGDGGGGPLHVNVDLLMFVVSLVAFGLLAAFGYGGPRVLGISTNLRDVVLMLGLYSLGLLFVLTTFVSPGDMWRGWLVVGIAALAQFLLTTVIYLWESERHQTSWNIVPTVIGSMLIAVGVLFVLFQIDFFMVRAAVGSGYGFLTAVAFVVTDRVMKIRSAGTHAGVAKGPTPVQATVTVRDGTTRAVVDRNVTLRFEKETTDQVSGTRSRQRTNLATPGQSTTTAGRTSQTTEATARGGQTTVELTPGTWTVTAQANGHTATQRLSVEHYTGELEVPVAGPECTVHVRSGDGEAIEGAEVHLTASDTNWETSETTNASGTITAHVPFGTETIDVSAEHSLHHPNSTRVEMSSTTSGQLTLAQRTGTLVTRATLGRESAPSVTITATRRRQPQVYVERRTDSRGEVQFDDILIGQYDVRAELPVDSAAFSTTGDSVTVEEGRRGTARIEVSFEYTHPPAVRDRIRTLRNRLDSLSRSSRRDDAIQGYYASVLRALLEEVESVPQDGYLLFEHRQDPGAVVDATLDAVEATVDMLENVLSSKRNVDLFSACSNLPDAEVTWSGNAALSELLARMGADIGQQRAEVGERLEAVDQRITEELRELAEVSPAREVWEGVREQSRDHSALDSRGVGASVYVSLLLLDAVEALFEHPELRKRLQQTVY